MGYLLLLLLAAAVVSVIVNWFVFAVVPLLLFNHLLLVFASVVHPAAVVSVVIDKFGLVVALVPPGVLYVAISAVFLFCL